MPAASLSGTSEVATDQEQWLVVDQLATAPPDFPELLKELHRNFGLDPYSARQRLLGRGYNLLLRGRRDHLAPLTELLTAHTITARLLVPMRIKTHPAKLQSLRRSAATLILMAADAELMIDNDVHVVAVLADLSGAAIANGVKQLLVRHAYQGAAAAVQKYDEELFCKAIIKGEPVLDLYLLDRQGAVRGAVRALPGEYDPAGLGAERTLSAGLNLLALLALARSRAGRWTLRSDFGLANLPGCHLDTPLDAANRGKNLAALSCFGSLAAQFSGQTMISPISPISPISLLRETDPQRQVPPVAALPPPPDTKRESRRRRLWQRGDTVGVAFVLVTLAIAGMGRGHLFPWFWSHGIGSGAVPALLALILLWRGFAAIRLKRLIENTPVSRIRSLATGMVEVCGRAERCYALVTPVTQVPCIYYRLSRYHRQERNGSWQLSAEQNSGLHPFWLSDATGKVLIDPTSADLRPGCRQEGSGDGFNNAFLGREAHPDSDEKWVEECIPEGETLYVLGFSTPHRVTGDSLHNATAARLRTLKQSPDLRQRFDKNNDGQIDADEWDEARRITADEVAKSHLAGRQQRRKQEEALVIGVSPRRSHPFLIAQSLNEGMLTRALWWRALGFFVFGLVLILWTLRQLFNFLPPTGY